MLIEDDVHDADALEFGDFVAKVIAHSPDLPVESLGQNNIEFVSIDLPNFTFIGDGVQNGNPTPHFMDKSFGGSSSLGPPIGVPCFAHETIVKSNIMPNR